MPVMRSTLSSETTLNFTLAAAAGVITSSAFSPTDTAAAGDTGVTGAGGRVTHGSINGSFSVNGSFCLTATTSHYIYILLHHEGSQHRTKNQLIKMIHKDRAKLK